MSENKATTSNPQDDSIALQSQPLEDESAREIFIETRDEGTEFVISFPEKYGEES